MTEVIEITICLTLKDNPTTHARNTKLKSTENAKN